MTGLPHRPSIHGTWVLIGLLGQGRTSGVYRARHRVVGCQAAIKVLRDPARGGDPRADRFLAELRLAGGLCHPNIARIYDGGSIRDSVPFCVMELLEGELLARRMARRPLALDELCDVGVQIGDALAAAHAAGLVHRNPAPAKVMLVRRGHEQAWCKLIGFGAATTAGLRTRRLTPTGQVVGPPGYASPEHRLGDPVDRRSDIFSFGVLLWAMATGKRPGCDRDGLPLPHAALVAPPLPVGRLASGEACPPTLEAVLARCLAPVPEDRYDRIEEVIAAMRAIQIGVPRHSDCRALGPCDSGIRLAPGAGERAAEEPAVSRAPA